MTLSASGIELAQRCEGSLTIKHQNEPNQFSEAGTELHAGDEQAINSGDVPDVYTDRWPGLTWRSEVSYMYDVSDSTSRFLGLGLKRAYGERRPFEVPGTIDVEGRGPGVLVVLDRKSFETVTPAATNPQVRFLALAAARYQPAERVYVGINHELTGMDVAELDPVFDLDVIAHDVKQLLKSTAEVRARARAGSPVAFVTGRWCRWCSGFNACPKQAELRALVARDDEDPELALATTLLDESDAPDVYELYKRIGILHKRIGQSLYAYAATRPIPLRNGKMFGRVDNIGNERLDGDVVYQVAKELHGQAFADAAVVRSATKKRLEDAAKSSGLKAAPTVKAVLTKVRELGGATRKAGEAFEEYEPGPKLVVDAPEPKELSAPEVAVAPF